MPMNAIGSKIEIIANITIVVVATLMGVVLVQRYILAPKNTEPPAVQAGATLSLPDIDWAGNDRTMVVAIQDGCHFCSESAPFYQRLVKEASDNHIPVVAVFPQPVETGQKYLNDLKVPINNVRQAVLKSIGVQGTPTLLLIDNTGKIVTGWVGKLLPDQEADVLSKLR
jgi:Redoxin.